MGVLPIASAGHYGHDKPLNIRPPIRMCIRRMVNEQDKIPDEQQARADAGSAGAG